MKRSLRSLLFATALVTVSYSAAFAEMVYNRGNTTDPESLDPHKTSTVNEAHILRDMFSGLVMQDAKAELIPGAATSWKVSEDGKVYTFSLRQGATWSNGDPVTADDFVYSFRRLEQPETKAEYASMMYVVKNAKEINEGKMKPEELGVRAVDANTFEVTLNAPVPYFLEMLTHQANYPVHKGSIEKLGDQWTKPGNLLSNGAFVLAEFIPNDHIKLVKNPKYYEADQVKLDVVNYFPVQERATALKQFEAGELDSNDDMPLEQLAEMKTKLGDQVRIGPYLGTYYYPMRTDKEPWSNPKLRRAISLAIDRDFLAEKIWKNSMIPGYSMVPPGIPGYEPAIADYAEMSQIDREDEAKKIFTELGISPEKPIKMDIRYNSSDNHKNTAVAIQEQLKPFGIEVTLTSVDGLPAHYGFLEQKGDYDYARAGWIADYKDPETFLGISRKASGNNYSNWVNPKFEELMDKAAAAGGNEAERSKLLSEAERVVVDDLGNMPLLYYSYHDLVSSKLKGFEDNVMDVHPSRFISKE